VNEVIKTRQLLGISQRTAALLAGVTEWRWRRWEKENAYEAMLLKFNQRKVKLGAADPRRRKYAAKWLQSMKTALPVEVEEEDKITGTREARALVKGVVNTFLEGRYSDLVECVATLLYWDYPTPVHMRSNVVEIIKKAFEMAEK